jgi:uncharacterized Zn finger protein (UPF0148 family)
MTNCPACGVPMTNRINVDAVVCPEHGPISGLAMVMAEGLPKLEADIELRAHQLHNWVRGEFQKVQHGA